MHLQTRWGAMKSKFGWLLVIAALTFSGCANLEVVAKFAKISASTADYQQVVGDYADSPRRQRSYQPERMAAQLDALVKRRAEQKPQLEGVQKVLVEYMSALGDLAADKLPNVDDEIDGIGKSLETAKFVGDGDAQIGKETTTAAASIAKVLVRAVLDAWRQCQVIKIVKETDPHLQIVVAGLKEVFDKDLRGSLDNEELAVRKPFQAWIAAATSGNDSDGAPPVARIILNERLEQVQNKRAKLDAYITVLDTIGKGHADLFANVDKMDDKTLKTRLQGYSQDLQTLHKAIKDLSK